MPATGSSAFKMKRREHLLMVADSEHDANMFYAVGMFVPDPFIFLRSRGRNCVVMSDLEIDRARKHAPHCSVLSLSRYQRRLRREGIKQPRFAEVIPALLRERGIRRVVVPQDFPYGLAADLQLASALPATDLVEYIAGSAYVDEIVAEPWKLDGNGMLGIPATPGLGLELDVDALGRYTDLTALQALTRP